MLNFDRFTVKHDTQNIQNDCHQCTKFVFGRGFGPTPLGELTALTQTLWLV